MFNVLCRCCCPAYNNAKSQAGAGHKGEGINEPDGDNFAKEQQRVVRANNREFNVHFAYAVDIPSSNTFVELYKVLG
jgi:hypothetical protein